MNRSEFQILVCRGPECAGRRHADRVWATLQVHIAEHGLVDRTQLARQNCFGRCRRGPNMLVRELVRPESAQARRASALYNGVSEGDVAEIVATHLLGGQVVERLVEPTLRTRAEDPEEGPSSAFPTERGEIY